MNLWRAIRARIDARLEASFLWGLISNPQVANLPVTWDEYPPQIGGDVS